MTDTTATTAEVAADIGHNSEAMDVLAMVREEPKAVFHDTKLLPKLVAQLDAQITAAPADVSTAKSRDEIRTRAADVARLKAALDKAGLELTEDFRKQTKGVNEVRNEITSKLDTLRDKAREPLTKWEEAEKARDEKVRDFRRYLEECLKVPAGSTLEQIAKRRAKIEAEEIDPAVYLELVDKVVEEKTAALLALDTAKDKVVQDAKDREELLELREANRIREAQAEADRKAAAAAEEARILREAQERERQEAIEKARQEEANRVRREAEAKAAEEQRQRDAADAEIRRKAQEEIDDANARARAAEDARLEQERIAREEKEERERIQREEEERERAEEEEAERRRLDQEHRANIIAEIEFDLAGNGASAAAAKRLAQALVAGSIRHATVEF